MQYAFFLQGFLFCIEFKNLYFCTPISKHPDTLKAQMAELVDALVSGTSVLSDVQVRVLFWAPGINKKAL